MTLEKPDVQQIMNCIREEVEAGLGSKGSLKTYRMPSKQSDAEAKQPILYSEDLNHLNANWHDWNQTTEINSHRKLIGPIIVKIKKFFLDLAWNNLFKGYFEKEREFNMHLVRYLNDNAKYIDKRDKQIFWDLVEKLDADIKAVNERNDRLYAELIAVTNQLKSNREEKQNLIAHQ